MKGFMKFFDFILTIIYVVENLLEILIIPIIFIAVGLLNDLSWQYYIATVGGYFIICIFIQIILHFVFKRFEKKYESFLMKLFKKKSNTCKPNTED